MLPRERAGGSGRNGHRDRDQPGHVVRAGGSGHSGQQGRVHPGHIVRAGGSGHGGHQDRDHPDSIQPDEQVHGIVSRSFEDNLKDRGREEPEAERGAQDGRLGSTQSSGTDAGGQGDGQREAPLAEAVGFTREGDQRAAQSPGVGEDGSGLSQEGSDEATDRPGRVRQDVRLREGDEYGTLQTSPREALLAWTGSLKRGDIVKVGYSTKDGEDAVFCIR